MNARKRTECNCIILGVDYYKAYEVLSSIVIFAFFYNVGIKILDKISKQ